MMLANSSVVDLVRPLLDSAEDVERLFVAPRDSLTTQLVYPEIVNAAPLGSLRLSSIILTPTPLIMGFHCPAEMV